MQHMMECSSEMEFDELLVKQVNKTINFFSSLNVKKLKAWFPSSCLDNIYYQNFNVEWGALGYLPQKLYNYLKKDKKVPKEKIEQCIICINNIVKNNRYNRYKSKRYKDKMIQKLKCLKQALYLPALPNTCLITENEKETVK